MPAQPTTVKPETPAAKVKQSPFRLIIPIILAIVVLGGIVLVVSRLAPNLPFFSQRQNQVELTYWGLWEPENNLKALIERFEADNPGITINYTQQKSTDYRDRLQTALQSGKGPHIFRYHQTWVPMLRQELAPLPETIYAEADYQTDFYPVVYNSLKTNKGIVGIPLMIDGLGLYYNQRLLTSAGQSVPQSWDELRRIAKQLTVTQNGVIERAGVAIGTTNNVEHWPDIFGVMLLQNSANPRTPNNRLGRDAIEFYTLFNRVDGVWDETLPTSTYAFATEKVAMMIAPSWRAHDVITINPNLEFAIAPIPQLHNTNVTWATFWVEGVSAKASRAEQLAAWKFVKFLSEKETLRQWYADISSASRRFGSPFPRVDMADQLSADPFVGAYIRQAPAAQTWYLASFTHDNGINDATIKYYEDAINAVNQGQSPEQALVPVEQGMSQIFERFNLR
jgi:multiple sugar transport system substrate-binding protein